MAKAAFKMADVQRAILAGQKLGLAVSGYEIEPGGRIIVRTAAADADDADAALEAFMRGRNGNRETSRR